ncbi:oligosaccharide flippase family protein [Thermococcus sp.]|uniref:oligosaccharide flippase family protein n=1 Tax=Thermococcus sp. TaxID=35749 RepID=UPI0019A68F20|nr:oligosaccharide flippase family protein [Thermococcus sp.]MBC7095423.1 oligosaccharide flippase family protein [Thermococcus sp.]
MGIIKNFSILGHEFYRDAFIMMVAMTLSNFFNYLYQLLMGRLLSPQEYGELFSLLSLFYIFSVFFTTINTSITKFVTLYSSKREYGKVKSILVKGTKTLGLLGVVIYIFTVLLAPFISNFLQIDSNILLIVLFASIPFGFLLPIYQGALRGLQRFGALGISVSSWAFFKLIFGVGLVVFGYDVLGGLLGVFLAHVTTFLLTVVFLKDILHYDAKGNIELRDILTYGSLAFLAIFAYTTMWNVDVILVKHYLSPLEAGQYSAISVLGKIVLFAPGAVGMVIFPKAAEMHEKGEKHFHVLTRGLAMTLLISGGIVLAYALFPEFIITFIYGEKYLSVAPYLWRYGLAMMFFSLASVVVNYSLSINKTGISFYLLGLLAAEIVSLSLSSKNISTMVNTLVGVSILMMIGLIIYIRRQRNA